MSAGWLVQGLGENEIGWTLSANSVDRIQQSFIEKI